MTYACNPQYKKNLPAHSSYVLAVTAQQCDWDSSNTLYKLSDLSCAKKGGEITRKICKTDVCFVKLYAGLAHTLRVLYLDASSAKYAGSQDKKRMLDQLCSGIASLPIEQCIHLLKV